MKRLLTIMLILAVTGGCASLQNAFCSPTVEQVVAAAENLSQATATLSYLEGLVPVPEIAAAIAALQIAIPILRQIKDGICVAAADEANANRVAQTSLKYAAALGYRGGK